MHIKRVGGLPAAVGIVGVLYNHVEISREYFHHLTVMLGSIEAGIAAHRHLAKLKGMSILVYHTRVAVAQPLPAEQVHFFHCVRQCQIVFPDVPPALKLLVVAVALHVVEGQAQQSVGKLPAVLQRDDGLGEDVLVGIVEAAVPGCIGIVIIAPIFTVIQIVAVQGNDPLPGKGRLLMAPDSFETGQGSGRALFQPGMDGPLGGAAADAVAVAGQVAEAAVERPALLLPGATGIAEGQLAAGQVQALFGIVAVPGVESETGGEGPEISSQVYRTAEHPAAIERVTHPPLQLDVAGSGQNIAVIHPVDGVSFGIVKGNAVQVEPDPLLGKAADLQVCVAHSVTGVGISINPRLAGQDHGYVLVAVDPVKFLTI
ncbi:hypothetical protein ES703_25123 [subsurface metagenome]